VRFDGHGQDAQGARHVPRAESRPPEGILPVAEAKNVSNLVMLMRFLLSTCCSQQFSLLLTTHSAGFLAPVVFYLHPPTLETGAASACDDRPRFDESARNEITSRISVCRPADLHI